MRLLVILAIGLPLLMQCSGEVIVSENGDEKKLVWGYEINGIAINARTEKAKYSVGERVNVIVTIRNSGHNDFNTWETGFMDYRFALFAKDGSPVPRSRERRDSEEKGNQSGRLSNKFLQVKAGEKVTKTIGLNAVHDLDRTGTFFLVVIKRLGTWDKGFLISNAARLEIVDKEKE